MAMPSGMGRNPNQPVPSQHSLEAVKAQATGDDEQAAFSLLQEEDLANLTELEEKKMDFKFWKKKAEEYTFGQGELVTTVKTTFPRLDHYKKCHEVAKDWARCKTVNKYMTISGICNPLRDQVAMCINDTWLERYKFRQNMYQNVWSQQELLARKSMTQSHYDRAFLGMMVDDHDAD
eukprot:TRINITY_DN10100_c0_g1_i1.p1 TRINITY_DN10100_c0_g1~~TRINITY_DN10100_c0_g1_i1.p1  ORF type:complete len:177 (+),score=84.73 TRINITY_DN10100_c0_g1_i1:87-617(+)